MLSQGETMRIHYYNDPFLKFKSTVEIGKYLISVSIDGLPGAEFIAHGLGNYLNGDARASATLLGFHATDCWKIPLSDLQTLERICEVLTLRGQPELSSRARSHISQAIQSGNLDDYWQNTMVPDILQRARKAGQVRDDHFRATVAWCNPLVSRFKMHPRATQFIQHHWPKIVAMHSSGPLAVVATA
jgi:hypothetical protein